MLRRGRVALLGLAIAVLHAVVGVAGALLWADDAAAVGPALVIVAAIGLTSGALTTAIAVVVLRATADREPDDATATTMATVAGSLFVAAFGLLALRGLGLPWAVLAVAALTGATHLGLRRGLPGVLL